MWNKTKKIQAQIQIQSIFETQTTLHHFWQDLLPGFVFCAEKDLDLVIRRDGLIRASSVLRSDVTHRHSSVMDVDKEMTPN